MYYISIAMSYLIIWNYFPIFSLLLFILFSSFHFGESELHHKGLKIHSFTGYFEATLLSFGILIFLLCSHVCELFWRICIILLPSFLRPKLAFNIFYLFIVRCVFTWPFISLFTCCYYYTCTGPALKVLPVSAPLVY